MRSVRTAALALSVLLVAAGCGDSDSESSDSPGSSEPATETSETPETSETSETSAPADDRSPAEVLDAAADATLAARRFSIESGADLEVGEQTLTLGSEGRTDYDAVISDVRINVEQGGQAQDIEILADGETAWVSATGGSIPPFPDGATYLEGDAATLADAESFSPEGLLGVVLVLRAGDDAEAGDTEEVDGTEARTYTFTVPYEDAVEAAGADAEAFQSALSLTGAGTSADLVVEVAVGADDVVRRLAIEIDGGDVPVGGTYDLELSDVGAEVAPPDAPAESDVASGPEAQSLFAQLLS